MEELTDQELDAWILTRLEIAGVDLSVLPEDDAEAPADRKRILTAARHFLRTTVRTISDLDLTPHGEPPGSIPYAQPPALYPSGLSAWRARDA